MISRQQRKETPTEVMVREAMPLRRVIVEQSFQHKNRSRHVEVNLELAAGKDGIQVTQTLNHGNAGMPFWSEFMAWVIHRFGSATGVPPLERLKAVAESAQSAR